MKPYNWQLATWLKMCSRSENFLREYDRLKGTNLICAGSPLDIMIDDATGKSKEDIKRFLVFCVDLFFRLREARGKPGLSWLKFTP